MGKTLSLVICILLAISLVACSNAKMTDKQTLACDTADVVISELFQELGEEYASVTTERKVIGETALYILHMKLEVAEIDQETIEIFQDVFVEEAELYVSPADVHVVAYYCNMYGEEEFRTIGNGIPEDVITKLD